jgi:hypothetical protein
MISKGPHLEVLQITTRPLPEDSLLDFTIRVSVRTSPGIAMIHLWHLGHLTSVATEMALAVTVSEARATWGPL